jgi:hypothetical protein
MVQSLITVFCVPRVVPARTSPSCLRISPESLSHDRLLTTLFALPPPELLLLLLTTTSTCCKRMLLSATLPLGLWVLGSTGSCSKQSLRSDLPSQYWLEAQSLGVGCKAILHGAKFCGPILSSAVMLLHGPLHFAVDARLANRDTRQVCDSAGNSLVLLLCVYSVLTSTFLDSPRTISAVSENTRQPAFSVFIPWKLYIYSAYLIPAGDFTLKNRVFSLLHRIFIY